jgi:hypothetical protein
VGHDLADEANKVQDDDLEAVAPIIVGEALELPRRRTAGVVDQNVDAAEALHGGGSPCAAGTTNLPRPTGHIAKGNP